MLLHIAVEQWLTFKAAEGLSRRTLSWYADMLSGLLARLGPVDAADVRAVELAAWLAAERERGLAPGSVDCRWRACAAFWSWAVLQGVVSASPMGEGRRRQVPRPRRSQPVVDAVTFEQYRRVTDAIDLASWVDYRDWCAVGVLWWCGLRLGELTALRAADVDLGHGLLVVRAGKGGKGRIVPAADELLAGLSVYLSIRPSGWSGLWLALDKAGRRPKGQMMQAGLRQLLRRRTTAVDLPGLHAHTWRHGFACAMLNAGVEMSAVAAMMGHSSVKVTESVYARWDVRGLMRQYKTAAALIAS